MLLNHERKTPADWDDARPSLCPDCSAGLLPRRGRILIWHWAHRAGAASSAGGCASVETFWHLAWKSVYGQFEGWDVEVPFAVDGKQYRLDAARLERSLAREFVHSLTERYIQKHLELRQSGLNILWIFDGDAFAASRRKPIRPDGYKHLLKPKARWLHSRIGGLVHFKHLLWREWKYDCWYPLLSRRTEEMTMAFSEFQGRYVEAESVE